MVILNKLPDLEVNIEVNGAKAQEYDGYEEIEVKPGPVGEYQAARTVARYIEAVDGAEFSIKCSLSPRFDTDSPNIQACVYVDSNFAEGSIITPEEIGSSVQLQGPKNFHPSSIGAGRWTLQKYRFSRLDISNEDTRLSSLHQDKAEAEKVGTIEVRIWRVSACKTLAAVPRDRNPSISSNKFHEKALKGQAKSHNISYSAEVPTACSRASATIIDGVDFPIAIYKFKYRSKEALKQLLIIERTPEPEDSPAPNLAPDVDLENLTAVQRERLKEFLRNEGIAEGRASNTPERKIKRERDNGEGCSNQAQRKKSKITEFIDLTADSDEDE